MRKNGSIKLLLFILEIIRRACYVTLSFRKRERSMEFVLLFFFYCLSSDVLVAQFSVFLVDLLFFFSLSF